MNRCRGRRPRGDARLGWLAVLLSAALHATAAVSPCQGSTPLSRGEASLRRPEELLKTDHRARVEIRRRDGSTIAGIYLGLSILPPDEYVRRYKSYLNGQPDAVRMPRLGEWLTLELASGASTAGVFQGFGYRFVRVGRDTTGAWEPVRLESVRTLRSESARTWSADSLLRVQEQGLMPLATAANIRSDTDTVRVAFDDILGFRLLQRSPSRRRPLFDGRIQGFVMGAGLGFTPRVSVGSDPAVSASGVAFRMTAGFGVTDRDVIEFLARGVSFTLDEWNADQSQTFRGGLWSHYFGSPGRSVVASAGLGQVARENVSYSCGCFCFLAPCPPCPDPCPAVLPPEGSGTAYVLGVAYEFHRRYRIAGHGLLGRLVEGDLRVAEVGLEIQGVLY